jgi:osmotically-inducible protein OsmY
MSLVVGAAASTLDRDEVGTVSDVLVDSSTGQIRFVVIHVNSDGRQLVAPWEVVTFDPRTRSLLLKVTSAKLATAPTWSADPSTGTTSPDGQWKICSYYGCRPYWDEPWEEEPTLSPPPIVETHRRWPQLVMAMLLLVAVGGLAYLTLQQGWMATAQQLSDGAAAVRETSSFVRSRSSDAVITARVKTALALSKDVFARDISVSTDEGVTTLTGKTGSPENRELAGQIAAATVGVRMVRNLLTIDPQARPEQGRRHLEHRVEDLERQAAITDALQDIPDMDGARVKVRVDGESVVLEGTVRSDAQRWHADGVARSFPGVRTVTNNLKTLNQES